MYAKIIHSLTLFIATQFLCAFLYIWKRFCDKFLQLMVKISKLSLFCEIDAHLNNAMVDWNL
jgi:hypothetical protein